MRLRKTVTVVIVTLILLLLVAALAASLALLRVVALSGAPSHSPVVVVQPAPLESEFTFAGEASIVVAGRTDVKAPNWTGIVTTAPQQDKVLENGDVLLSVDGVNRFLCAGDLPFYRDLFLGDEGADVSQLRACLGLVPGTRVTQDVLTAFRKKTLAPARVKASPTGSAANQGQSSASAGVAPSTSGSSDGMQSGIDISRVLWTPLAPTRVAVSKLTPGAMAPAQGQVVVTVIGAANKGSVSVLGASTQALQQLSNGATSLSFATDTQKASLAPDGTLDVSGDAWGWAAAQARAENAQNPTGGAATSAKLRGTITITGAKALTVPVAAIYGGEGGKQCLALADGDSYAGHAVSAVAVGWGRVIVWPVDANVRIAANPTDIDEGPPPCR